MYICVHGLGLTILWKPHQYGASETDRSAVMKTKNFCSRSSVCLLPLPLFKTIFISVLLRLGAQILPDEKKKEMFHFPFLEKRRAGKILFLEQIIFLN